MQKLRLEHVKRRSLRTAAAFGLGVASLCVAADPASAQDTRAEVIQQQQVGKTTQLQPPQMNGVERLIDRLEDWGFMAAAPRGFYPWFGSVYPGGGFAAGAGVRKPFGDDGGVERVRRLFAAVRSREADVALPTFAQPRARHLVGPVHRRTRCRYSGVGDSSLKEDQLLRLHAVDRRRPPGLRRQQIFSVGGGVESTM